MNAQFYNFPQVWIDLLIKPPAFIPGHHIKKTSAARALVRYGMATVGGTGKNYGDVINFRITSRGEAFIHAVCGKTVFRIREEANET
jgi:hypothetical protein